MISDIFRDYDIAKLNPNEILFCLKTTILTQWINVLLQYIKLTFRYKTLCFPSSTWHRQLKKKPIILLYKFKLLESNLDLMWFQIKYMSNVWQRERIFKDIENWVLIYQTVWVLVNFLYLYIFRGLSMWRRLVLCQWDSV